MRDNSRINLQLISAATQIEQVLAELDQTEHVCELCELRVKHNFTEANIAIQLNTMAAKLRRFGIQLTEAKEHLMGLWTTKVGSPIVHPTHKHTALSNALTKTFGGDFRVILGDNEYHITWTRDGRLDSIRVNAFIEGWEAFNAFLNDFGSQK